MRTIEVDGMSCGGCEDAVVEALRSLPGVESATADHERGTASIEGDADDEAIADAVDSAGYEAAV